MSLESNKIIARRSFEDVWNQYNPDAVDKLYATDYIAHNDLPGVTPDRKGFKKWVTDTIKAFPDLEFSIRDQIAEGDEVVTRWRVHGTQKGDFMGVPATHKEVNITGLSVSLIKDNKITEGWLEWDSLGMLQQLGAVSPPG